MKLILITLTVLLSLPSFLPTAAYADALDRGFRQSPPNDHP
jgi:hypothetical protein